MNFKSLCTRWRAPVNSLTTSRHFHSSPLALSHIGRTPLAYSNDVVIEQDTIPITQPRIPSEYNNTMLHIKGPLGQLQLPIKPFVKLNFTPATPDSPTADNLLEVAVEDETVKEQKAMWGTTRALINNAIVGVSEGFKVHLRLIGVGYRGTLENNNRTLSLKLGYSHPILMDLPEGVSCTIPTPNRIILQGINLQQVKQFAAEIRRWRKPEPYNQKGIFVDDETIKKKDGKRK
ncbi:ribosomal protein L6, alpha-beta domain-containing protein [Mycotypha africana]|uniref:ribosomal protein L6, alpha-beta domain-containing protein n=1 Tax=Mycotypha africana TaxID=64632 RepID=UPI00230184E7|nr:ribosomal protein L6, alpha-beta domain-containing protein [Mycotypha africana]KAI8987535.1 ribosomal protein L6, alpha-beta domain-containing protein [Mycotypha africana]